MDEPHATLLEDLAAEVAFGSRESMRVAGRTYSLTPDLPTLVRSPPPYPPIVSQLGHVLYESFYATGGIEAFRKAHAAREVDPRGARPSLLPVQAVTDPASYPDNLLEADFVRHLARHNATEASVSRGWRLVSRTDMEAVVQDADGKRRTVAADAFSTRVVGDLGDIRLPTALVDEGWYHARGATPLFVDVTPTVRVYWDVTRTGAGRLVQAATKALNERRTPFQMKVLTDPRRYTRVDAGVLYVPREGWSGTLDALARIRDELACYLKPATPPFAKRLAAGVALAEHPPGPESFGGHRCRLAAEGLWEAFLADGEPDAARRLRAMRERFLREGVDPDRPHLAPGREDHYPALGGNGRAPIEGVDAVVQ